MIAKYHEENKKIVSKRLKAKELEEEINTLEGDKNKFEAVLEELKRKLNFLNDTRLPRTNSGRGKKDQPRNDRSRTSSHSEFDVLEMQMNNAIDNLKRTKEKIAKITEIQRCAIRL